MKNIPSLASLSELVGQEVARSEWVLIDQDRINRFAAATGDHQWIHRDEERCRQDPKIGTTVAHGFLTLSLVSALMQESIQIGDIAVALNYGLNRVRFPAPLPAESRVRAHFKLLSVEAATDAVRGAWLITLEREESAKPVCVAELLVQYYPASS